MNNTYESSFSKPSNFKLTNTKEDKLAAIVQAAEVAPVAMRNGLKPPGLVAKSRPFMSPMVNKNTQESSNKNQLKRRSDTFIFSKSYSNVNHNTEMDEDSFILNQDLEALCQNSSIQSKRVKKD